MEYLECVNAKYYDRIWIGLWSMKSRYFKNGEVSCPTRIRYRYSSDTAWYSYRKSIG
jgi:hypothetical protein